MVALAKAGYSFLLIRKALRHTGLWPDITSNIWNKEVMSRRRLRIADNFVLDFIKHKIKRNTKFNLESGLLLY